MASRFWAAGGSGSDSASDSDSDSGSSEGGDKGQQRRQWARDSDSESEDEVRVVKSAKDRAWEGVRSACSKIRTKMKINDWNGIQTDFEELTKHVSKNQILINKEGLPKFYIKLLADLEDILATAVKDKAAVKKMSATNTRALNRMKLSLKKHNRAYETELAACRADPAAYEEEAVGGGGGSGGGSSSESDSDEESSSEESGSESESEEEEDDEESGSEAEEKKAAVAKGKAEAGGKAKKVVADSDSESDSDSDDSEKVKPKEKAKKPQRALDEMDSDEWPSESESESESEEDAGDMPKGRAFWLKKTVGDDKKVKKKEDKKALKQAGDQDKKGKKEKVIEVRQRAGGAAAFKLDEDLKPEDLDKKLLEVLAARGRKGSDPRDVLRQLQALAYASRRFGAAKELPTAMHLVSAMFDTLRNLDDYMDVGMWKNCHGYLMRVVKVLDANPNLQLGQVAQEDIADLVLASRGELKERSEDMEEEVKRTGMVKVVGTLISHVQRLEEEYTKSVQKINPHTAEYIARLRDEAAVVTLAAEVQRYYERFGDARSAAVMALVQVEHLYYRHDSIAGAVHRAQIFSRQFGAPSDLHPACRSAAAAEAAAAVEAAGGDFAKVHPATGRGMPVVEEGQVPDYGAVVQRLCTYVYRHGDDRCKTRAMLCHIHHHALHDRFHAARDLLLMSHLQDSIGHTDVATQILYNRMMVTLGLCAFRLGLIHETHDCLRDVCSSRVKELLAQGVQLNRFADKSTEQEKAERRRQMPYHMHINLDLLECCHLTAAMLLEVPNMAQEGGVGTDASRRRVISKHFRRFLDIYNRQVFTGPPENIRDHVIAAAKCLMSGEWQKCSELLLGLDVWGLVPGEGAAARVKAMLREKIQVEVLRTYLFTYAAHYESLSLPRLCDMFGVDKKLAHSVISKMMIGQELFGSWDQPSETIVLHKVEPSHLQVLALQFADKAATLVESNERLLDARTGGYGYRDDKNWGRRSGAGGGADWVDRKGFSSDKWKAGGTYRGGGGGGRGSGGGPSARSGGRNSYLLGRGTGQYRGDRVQRDEKRSRGLF